MGSEPTHEPAAQYVTEEHTFELFPGDLVDRVIVLGTVVSADGSEGLLIASAGMGQVGQIGMVEAARQILNDGWTRRD